MGNEKPVSTEADCYSALAKTLVLLREIKGISMREHASQLGVSPATLCRIEDGRGCDLATLVRIHKVTGVKLHTLLGEKAALEGPHSKTQSGAVEGWNSRTTAAKPEAPFAVDVDWLAQQIRIADGNQNLGAGALAEKLCAAINQVYGSAVK